MTSSTHPHLLFHLLVHPEQHHLDMPRYPKVTGRRRILPLCDRRSGIAHELLPPRFVSPDRSNNRGAGLCAVQIKRTLHRPFEVDTCRHFRGNGCIRNGRGPSTRRQMVLKMAKPWALQVKPSNERKTHSGLISLGHGLGIIL